MPETFSQHYVEKVNRFAADRVAVRQKELGIWREWSWSQSLDETRAIALGLTALGLKRGEHVVGIGDNDRQFLWAYLGVLSAGGAMVGLYTEANATEAAYIVDHSDAVYVLAQDQEQVDKMLEVREQLPNVRKVIYWNESGLWDYDDPWLMSYQEVHELGMTLHKKEPAKFDELVAGGQADDLALICYTSGTTGQPKGVMLSHHAMLKAAELANDVDARLDSDNHVSFLPLGWIAEHVLGIAGHCYHGYVINFPEEPETVRQDLREIAPEFVIYGSRLWDNLVNMIQVRIQDATWLNRKLYDTFMPIGYQVADKRLVGAEVGAGLGVLNWIGDKLLFGPMRDSIGMSNIRTAFTGGAALSPDAVRFFHGIGINLKQVYGMTEIAIVGTIHRNGDIKPATVGQPVSGVDIRISERGEIEVASPTMFSGYYKDPEKTTESIIEEDGKRWFLTSDAGYIDDDGHLVYLDLLKDMIELSNGEKFSPQLIEGRLKFNAFVQEVMAIGDPSRDSVTALVVFDFGNVAGWAEKEGIDFSTFADLSQNPKVLELMKRAVEEANESLPKPRRIQAFAMMPKPFDADSAEMTRSGKLRRDVLVGKYSGLIDALYGSAETTTIESQVTNQDGDTNIVRNEVKVVRI